MPSPRAVGLDRQPAQARHVAVEQQPAGADTLPVVDRDEVGRLVVAAVAVGGDRHALLAAEHALAQLERGGDLRVALCRPDVQSQRA